MPPPRGFSLIEVTVVLVVVTVLFAILAAPLAGQLDARRREEARLQLERVRDALYGFAAANGRLPCPAAPGNPGVESPAGGGPCTVQAGALPGVTLGLSPLDAQGGTPDPWADGSAARRFAYAVSNANDWALTRPGGVRAATMSTVSITDQLVICAPGLAAPPPPGSCGTATLLGNRAPAVVWSRGAEAGPRSPDEANNLDGDAVYTSGSPNAGFDDLVLALSLNTLFDRLLRAGQLP